MKWIRLVSLCLVFIHGFYLNKYELIKNKTTNILLKSRCFDRRWGALDSQVCALICQESNLIISLPNKKDNSKFSLFCNSSSVRLYSLNNWPWIQYTVKIQNIRRLNGMPVTLSCTNYKLASNCVRKVILLINDYGRV